MRMLPVAALLAAAALASCASPDERAGLAAGEPLRLVRGDTGSATSLEALLASLSAADYVLLGEVHDNAAHHRLQEMLLAHLAANDVALVMEPFDLDHQPALDIAVAANGYADALAAAAGGAMRSWIWAGYRPLVEIALAHRMPIVAGNLSRASARAVAATGFDALPRAESLRLEAVWNAALDAQLTAEIAEAHCGQLPARHLPGMARAQRARDAVMAERLLRHPRGVLIAGTGHARIDRGVPLYLRDRAPAAKVVSVGFVEWEGERTPRAPLPFDYAWITAPAERADPCAGFTAPRR